MKLVIFAGGLGTRISEETDHVPKPMVKIGKKPIFVRDFVKLLKKLCNNKKNNFKIWKYSI